MLPIDRGVRAGTVALCIVVGGVWHIAFNTACLPSANVLYLVWAECPRLCERGMKPLLIRAWGAVGSWKPPLLIDVVP